MKTGISIFPTDYTIGPADLAREVEERGFESLFVCEHSHQPLTTEQETGRKAADEFSHTFDPFVALTAAASVTSTLVLGTAVCLVVQRDPIHLAKQVASVDVLCGGRLVLGVGGGWNLPEMRNHGTKPELRWRIMAERVEAMRAIWTNDVAEYHGTFVDFGPMELFPKPAQKPAPPVLVGGGGPRTLQRVVDYGDGWIPVGQRVEDLQPRVEQLRKMADAAGRPEPTITVFAAPRDVGILDGYEALGVDRVLFHLPAADADAPRRALDDLAPLRR